jgi:hypothetical protein
MGKTIPTSVLNNVLILPTSLNFKNKESALLAVLLTTFEITLQGSALRNAIMTLSHIVLKSIAFLTALPYTRF